MEKMTKARLNELIEYRKEDLGAIDTYYTISSFVREINDLIIDCGCEIYELRKVIKEVEMLDDDKYGVYVYDSNYREYELIQLIEE